LKVLLGVTGSVAATLGMKLVDAFVGDDVRVVATAAATRFTDFHPRATVLTEKDEWPRPSRWKKVGDPILHIELREWMDVLVIAPLSANSLGKMANGICDNLLMSVWLASGRKPVIVAPAMNTQMWLHPAVQKNVASLKEMGVLVVEPVRKTLACGETGVGALAPMSHVVAVARAALKDSRKTGIRCAR
jgi:phosphopantothenoylcysteine decarboxylase